MSDCDSFETMLDEYPIEIHELNSAVLKFCMCKGKSGVVKNTYSTKSEANAQAAITYNGEGIKLSSYKCEYGPGWHLTKSL